MATHNDEEHLSLLKKILREYSDKISTIRIHASGRLPGSSQSGCSGRLDGGDTDELTALLEKINSFDEDINLKIKKENVSFQKVWDKISLEIARLPSGVAAGGLPSQHLEANKPPKDPESVHNIPDSETKPIALHLLTDTRMGKPQAPASISGFWKITGLILIVTAVAAAVIWHQRNSAEKFHRVFPLSYSRTAGLAVKYPYVFSIDPQRQLIFTIYQENGGIKSVKKFPNQNPTGLSFGDDHIWSSDGVNVYQHDMNSDYSVRRKFTNPGHNPGGLCWDSGFLWIGDSKTATISKYAAGSSLDLIKQYALPGIMPSDFYVSGDILWIPEPAGGKIIRYRAGPSLNKVDSIELSSWLSAGSRIAGFAAEESLLWVVTENPAELHRFDLKHLQKQLR
ncbi:MAG: hypothetical protein HY746_04295 [Elusimicrobia bacterium]|nr:hypothetical protein [Elusimicrobiota bacterium]